MKTAFYILKLIIKAFLSLKKKTEGIEFVIEKLPFSTPNTFFINMMLSKSQTNMLLLQIAITDENGKASNKSVEIGITELMRTGIIDEAKLVSLCKAKIFEQQLIDKNK